MLSTQVLETEVSKEQSLLKFLTFSASSASGLTSSSLKYVLRHSSSTMQFFFITQYFLFWNTVSVCVCVVSLGYARNPLRRKHFYAFLFSVKHFRAGLECYLRAARQMLRILVYSLSTRILEMESYAQQICPVSYAS